MMVTQPSGFYRDASHARHNEGNGAHRRRRTDPEILSRIWKSERWGMVCAVTSVSYWSP